MDRTKWIGAGIAVGILLGIAIHDIAIGILLGVAFGAAIAAVRRSKG